MTVLPHVNYDYRLALLVALDSDDLVWPTITVSIHLQCRGFGRCSNGILASLQLHLLLRQFQASRLQSLDWQFLLLSPSSAAP